MRHFNPSSTTLSILIFFVIRPSILPNFPSSRSWRTSSCIWSYPTVPIITVNITQTVALPYKHSPVRFNSFERTVIISTLAVVLQRATFRYVPLGRKLERHESKEAWIPAASKATWTPGGIALRTTMGIASRVGLKQGWHRVRGRIHDEFQLVQRRGPLLVGPVICWRKSHGGFKERRNWSSGYSWERFTW